MPETLTACPICNSDKIIPYYKREDMNYQYCLSCLVFFQSPRMTEEESLEYYRTGYRSGALDRIAKQYGFDEQAAIICELAYQQERARRIVDAIPAGFVPKSHLDIGCSAGMLLKAVKNKYGNIDSVGIDPDRTLATEDMKIYFNTFGDMLDEELCRGGEYDLITMIHTLEHLSDPLGYLQDAHSVLSPQGLMMIEVPNGLADMMAWRKDHPFVFTPESLAKLVKRVFKYCKIVTDPHNILVYASDEKEWTK